ncbi:LptA/OstA family protein [Candidatus Margulisiibacteriota bacterium]
MINNKKVFLLFLLIFLSFPQNSFCKKNPKLIINANSLVFDGKNNTILASKKVNALYKDIYLTANSVKYFHEKKTMSLSGNVALSKKSMKLTCINLFIDHKNDLIKALGAVKINYVDEITGQANKALYNTAKNIITLSGNAIAKQGKDTLKGENIVIFINTKKVVTKGRTKILVSPERFK